MFSSPNKAFDRCRGFKVKAVMDGGARRLCHKVMVGLGDEKIECIFG
jgi:hypothetical protein